MAEKGHAEEPNRALRCLTAAETNDAAVIPPAGDTIWRGYVPDDAGLDGHFRWIRQDLRAARLKVQPPSTQRPQISYTFGSSIRIPASDNRPTKRLLRRVRDEGGRTLKPK